MNILLDPNVAYLVLVIGFLTAILALFSPGTGVLEVVGLFLLVAAGYAIYNLPINWWALGVLLIGVFPFILALRMSRRLVYLIVAWLALLIGSIFLFQGNLPFQPAVHPLLGLVVSALVTGFLWIVGRKGLEAIERQPTMLRSLVGSVGETRTPVFREGSVYAGGEMWSAESDTPIPANTPVRVVRVEGFKLYVVEEKKETAVSK